MRLQVFAKAQFCTANQVTAIETSTERVAAFSDQLMKAIQIVIDICDPPRCGPSTPFSLSGFDEKMFEEGTKNEWIKHQFTQQIGPLVKSNTIVLLQPC